MTPAIRALHRLEPWRNWSIALFYAIWLGGAALAINVDWLPLRIAGWLGAGASLQSLGILMHEGVHYLLSRNRRVNRWLGFVSGLPTFLSVSSYRTGHLPHHRHERGARDPDELENLSRDPRVLALLFLGTFAAGELFGFWRVGPWNALRTNGTARRDILAEYAIIAAIFATAFLWLPFSWLLHGWLVPAAVACQLTNVRTLAEHVLTAREGRESLTRTVTSNRVVSFFMCNLNYHAAHHRHPGVPWYHLRELHAELAPELARSGSQIYRSYVAFLLDLARFVTRALAPGGRTVPLRLHPGRS